MRTLLLVALLAAALVAAPALASTRGVRIVDNRFSPATLTVRAGDTVAFRNGGQRPHNAVVTRGPQRFSSPLLRSGETYRRKLTRRGTYRLVCTLHAGMRMTLRVR